jgi:type III secretory pathway component EscU
VRNCGKPQMKTQSERMSQETQAEVISRRVKRAVGGRR